MADTLRPDFWFLPIKWWPGRTKKKKWQYRPQLHLSTLCPKKPLWPLPTYRGENEAFSPPLPPRNVMPLFELPVENNKYPNFEWRRRGVWIVLFSEVTPFEDNFSTMMSPTAGSVKGFMSFKIMILLCRERRHLLDVCFSGGHRR